MTHKFLHIFTFGVVSALLIPVCYGDSVVDTNVSSASEPAQTVDQTKSKYVTARHRALVSSDLHIYKILQRIKTNINRLMSDAVALEAGQHEVAQKDPEAEAEMKKLLTVRELTQDTLTLLGQIVQDLNDARYTYNPELEYRFVKMCNHLKIVELDDIMPCHIRSLEKEVKRFNKFMTVYCISRKNFLSEEDFSLFNKLGKFNQILMLCLLREDYFDIGVASTLSDWFVHQPIEFVSDHPWWSALIAAAVLIPAGYFVYDRFIKEKNPYNVVNVSGSRQGLNQCGAYAALNAIVFNGAETEEENKTAKKLVQQDNTKLFGLVREKLLSIRRAATTTCDSEIRRLKGPVIMSEEARERDLTYQYAERKRLNTLASLEFGEIEQLVNDAELNNAIRGALGLKACAAPPLVIQSPKEIDMLDKVAVIRDLAHSKTAVCYVGDDELGSYGHWLVVHMQKDDQSYKGVRGVVVDSVPGSNQTNSKKIRELFDTVTVGADQAVV